MLVVAPASAATLDSQSPVAQEQSTKAVDIVIIFDRSESMDDNRYKFATELESLKDQIVDEQVDARYALLTYAETTSTKQGWTTDFDDIDQALNFPTSGDTERASDALLTASNMDFRDGATRIFVLVSDEDDDSSDETRSAALDAISGSHFITVGPDDPSESACAVHSPPCDSESSNELHTMAGDVGGEQIDVDDETVVDQVSASIDAAVSGTATTSVAIGGSEGGADFRVINVSFNRTTVEIDEPVGLNVTVLNEGGSAGIYEANLADSQKAIGDKEMRIAAGQTRTIHYSLSFPEPDDPYIFLNHDHLGQITVTPLRPTTVETAVMENVTGVEATVTDARANSAVRIPLDGAQFLPGVPIRIEAAIVTPSQETDFELTLAAESSDQIEVASLEPHVRPLRYLVWNDTLADDEIENVTFEYTTETGSVRFYHYNGTNSTWNRLSPEVASETANGSTTRVSTGQTSLFAVGVPEPAFTVRALDLPNDAVSQGEPVTARVTIENVGIADGIYKLTLMADGSPVAQTNVSVPAAGERTTTLSFIPDTTGQVQLAIEDAANGTATVTVQSQKTPNGSTPEAEDPTNTGGQPGFGVGLAVVGLILAVYLGRRRR